MSNKNDIDIWADAQQYQIQLDSNGKIIDFLDKEKTRENTPEERIRQKTTQILHYEFGYPKNKIAHEKTIHFGREKKRADIIIYSSPRAKTENDQGKIVLIIETKAPNEKSADGQCKSYISSTSAQGGFWTNGDTIFYYKKNNRTGEIDDWIGIPKHGLAWDSIGKFKKSDLIQPIDLKFAFKRCHNALYRAGIDSEDIALDMVRIILAKIEDESTSKEECEFHITPDEFDSEKAKQKACHRVRNLFESVRERYPDVFSLHEKITASDNQLSIVISHIQQYSFLEAPYDIIGTAYEVYVASNLKGERGQYFTNRLAVNMMVNMLDPSDKDIILDPACGPGGFLIASMNHIFDKIDASKRGGSAKEILKRNVVHNLYGIDISPKLVKIAKANMLIGKDGHGGIEHGNSLNDLNKLSATFIDRAGPEKPTMILTNPPFGSGHDIRIKETHILSHFLSGKTWTVDDKNNFIFDEKLNSKQGIAPEVLFIERCIEWVKPGGTIGIVMAKGQLDNREALFIRKYILDTCQLLAVVNLHEDTFEPFCGSKASVIFLKKRTKETPTDYKVFMAISNKVGQTSRGEPIFKKDAEGTPIVKDNHFTLDEDLSSIARDYKEFKKGELKESEFRFSISSNTIREDTYSLNPIQYLPKHNAAIETVINLGERPDFNVHRLGDIAKVFNGPRFKRPYAENGVTEGETIHKYFTGTAITQLNSDNIKHLDSRKANKQTQKHLKKLIIKKGYILISDSGTLGRVSYALNQHDGHIATNNLIRVVIDDKYTRAYVYQFLKTDIGQSLMLKNAYGTNQEHLEPDVIADIIIPFPSNREDIISIGEKVLQSIEDLESSIENNANGLNEINALLSD